MSCALLSELGVNLGEVERGGVIAGQSNFAYLIYTLATFTSAMSRVPECQSPFGKCSGLYDIAFRQALGNLLRSEAESESAQLGAERKLCMIA